MLAVGYVVSGACIALVGFDVPYGVVRVPAFVLAEFEKYRSV